MYVSTSYEPRSKHLKVHPVTTTVDGWDYSIEIGYGTHIYLSRAELVALTNQSIRLIADAWADEADNAE